MSVRLWTLAVVLAAGSMLAGQSASSRQVEWPFVGGDQENTKYSALADINADTVQRLHIVWQWQHGETRRDDYQTAPGNFETTPLMIDGVLYVTLPRSDSRHGGAFPLVVQSHGWGAPPTGPNDTQYGGPTAVQWAKDGYAVTQHAFAKAGDYIVSDFT